MNGINATKHRTIPRHLRIRPYDRSERRRILGYELSLYLLKDTEVKPIGSIDDFCDFIAVCHSPCNREEAQSCGDYHKIYEDWKRGKYK